MDDSDEREIRATRNQAMFRRVNDKIAEINEVFGSLLGTFAITCECADARCIELIEIPADAYGEIRLSPRTFVVRADHVQPDVETVVGRHDGYVVVEATGRGIDVAEAEFQRDATPTGK